jgi:hypothetical protein
MRPRQPLLDLARTDYHAKRYYAVVLVLLAVMDGFVNDVEVSQRRGLHARTADEMVAWDSVVGHHLGLSHAHGVFTKSTFKTSEEPLYELQRNGIVHGTLVNFDNPVVATKAWNRLFAVADWARSLEREKKEPEPPTPFRTLLRQLAETAEARRALDEWQPCVLASTDSEFATNAVVTSTRRYLEAWQSRNYGTMAGAIPSKLAEETPGKTAGRVREEYRSFELLSFEIREARFVAAAVCEMEVVLTFPDGTQPAQMRWIRETKDGSPATPNQPGDWRLWLWGPWAMLNRAED